MANSTRTFDQQPVIVKVEGWLGKTVTQYIYFFNHDDAQLPFPPFIPANNYSKDDKSMAPRRGAPSSNTLSPQDPLMPSASSPGIPRSASPSGFTQFLTKPSKWFTRSASTSKLPNNHVTAEPRSSGGSGRKHKISRPTDPRPILDGYVASSTSR